uniref:Phage protein n=1 Tax=Bacillus phage Jabberwock TaxID=3163548 RepID=A0AAU8EHL8_9CAUD
MDANKLIEVLERKYDRQERFLKKFDDLDHDTFTDREGRILERGMYLGAMLAYEMAIIAVERMSENDRTK